jgi:hypothetical protein
MKLGSAEEVKVRTRKDKEGGDEVEVCSKKV